MRAVVCVLLLAAPLFAQKEIPEKGFVPGRKPADKKPADKKPELTDREKAVNHVVEMARIRLANPDSQVRAMRVRLNRNPNDQAAAAELAAAQEKIKKLESDPVKNLKPEPGNPMWGVGSVQHVKFNKGRVIEVGPDFVKLDTNVTVGGGQLSPGGTFTPGFGEDKPITIIYQEKVPGLKVGDSYSVAGWLQATAVERKRNDITVTLKKFEFTADEVEQIKKKVADMRAEK